MDDQVQDIRDGKKGASTGSKGLDLGYFAQILEALWRPPTATDKERRSEAAQWHRPKSSRSLWKRRRVTLVMR